MRQRTLTVTAAALAGGAALAGTAIAAPGDLDPSFGTGGVTSTQSRRSRARRPPGSRWTRSASCCRPARPS